MRLKLEVKMTDKKTLRTLANLYKIVEAGEKGYAVCAANIDNPGLNILFKSFSQQRAQFKNEILDEIKRIGGGDPHFGSSILGIIHRGRVDIFAAMASGRKERESVILGEIIVGEKAAMRAYDRALRGKLPVVANQFVSRQREQVRIQLEAIYLLRGYRGKQMLVQLFDRKADANRALQVLEDSGSRPTKIEQIDIQNLVDHHIIRGNSVRETAISGAVGGGLWGCVVGTAAGLSADYVASAGPIASIQPWGTWAYIALAGIAGGALIGMFLGTVIGAGISEQDAYKYTRSMQQGQILLLVTIETGKILEAQQIIAQAQS
jgi:uncharacterized protein (TIGR02284 family)